jgi:hypothetical protein
MSKDLCTYHQSNPAVWACDACERHYCSQCVVVIDDNSQTTPDCPLCDTALEYLGSGNSAQPFWSVAHRFFVYPLAPSGIAFMALVGLMSLVMPFGFLGLFAFLFTVAVSVKYCFAALESVALGSMQAPSVSQAVSGDEDHLFGKLVGLLIAIGFTQAVAEILIGPVIGGAFAVLFTLITPAMIMLLAFTKEIGESVSPRRILGLIVTLGWPYVLAVFLTNIISTGPYLVVEIFAETLFTSLIALPILAALIAYFAVVNFAMLGYLLFEHQGSLGFTAGDPDEERVPENIDNQRKRLMGEVNVLAKEGRHEEALKRFAARRSGFAQDMVYYQRYFDFARQYNNEQATAAVSDPYLELLMSKDAVDQALDVWRDAALVSRTFKPKNPASAHVLAERAHSKNLNKEALSLLVNLHKRSPQYPQLDAAYKLAGTVLRESGDTAKAEQLESSYRLSSIKGNWHNKPPVKPRQETSRSIPPDNAGPIDPSHCSINLHSKH